MILGIIVGYIAWTFLWLGSDAVFSAISSDWAAKSVEFRAAVEKNIPYTPDSTILIVLLVKSVIVTIISGFAAALVAGENTKSTIILGVLLLISGIFVQIMHWNYMPLWYHIPFLLMLIPMTILGGKLRKI
jgi:archaellum biogenesis protein FlaJ (TadC family)